MAGRIDNACQTEAVQPETEEMVVDEPTLIQHFFQLEVELPKATKALDGSRGKLTALNGMQPEEAAAEMDRVRWALKQQRAQLEVLHQEAGITRYCFYKEFAEAKERNTEHYKWASERMEAIEKVLEEAVGTLKGNEQHFQALGEALAAFETRMGVFGNRMGLVENRMGALETRMGQVEAQMGQVIVQNNQVIAQNNQILKLLQNMAAVQARRFDFTLASLGHLGMAYNDMQYYKQLHGVN
ncbi:uncharacterized protein LOC129590816 [Paramacrobiotus metropolitanus]|uniref:uncharacterized protein LOC129590816 n=1 Tax=Paramacrobiotus metropolitanus TaxID=2943436 RepID=UPI00244643E5|nr:uncharacterized protein LOC129590816 [Paramacrobiotus metropolitanus]XP_055342193.1 uncharacterized protein LOC129590816 [Paramacrobiotus metropolitanus]XP_055342194.1 uncharacterized protein LOC129590816 [Paramacrobiotus metropolitanus]XP_055342195.1 uncharacterized protein LOC129590816 [Paramacrobiotus metropolitanus]